MRTLKTDSQRRPYIQRLYDDPVSGPEIEARSFAAIDRLRRGDAPNDRRWQIVRRMIHTCADFSIANRVRFSPDAIESAIQALCAGRPIFADSNMIRSGLSLARLQSVHSGYGPNHVRCHVADPDVTDQALKAGLPRSLFAVRKAAPMLHDGIAVFGNAPVALLELNRLIMEKVLRPALVIAMPVGFVHVLESKRELMGLDVPYIVLTGRRGGSGLAVSCLHALCALASETDLSNKKENFDA